MKWLKDLKQNARYIVGCSGGPDSMALLDMCHKEGLDVIVAHMNYQKRTSALRDEKIVKTYCEQYGIPCVIKRQQEACVGNFQAFAREKRYFLYQTLLQQNNAEAVLLAHHLDDHLETYLMQKERGSVGNVYGIANTTTLYGCKIIRPLMTYTKQDLLAYCIQEKVPYGFDESNFSDDYMRNRIRHKYIDHMDKQSKAKLVEEIAAANRQLQQYQKQAQDFLFTWKQDVTSLLSLTSTLQAWVLRLWIVSKSKQQISHKLLAEILRLLPKANNWTKKLDAKYCIYKEYGFLHIEEESEHTYCYRFDTFDSLMNFHCPYFDTATKGKTVEALTLSASDFPIIIRNVQKADAITLRFGTKKVHRWFIDKKIPSWQRNRWPVVENAQKQIVLVPGIGCDIAHFSNNPSVFVVK